MASSALVRVTGEVLAASTRSGVSTKSGSPVPWEMTNVNVLVADQNVTVVQLPRKDDFGRYPTLAGGAPTKREWVDYLCEVTVFAGAPALAVIGDFPELAASADSDAA